MLTELQHYLNPLHIFCLMRRGGLAQTPAVFLCRIYEQIIFGPFLGKLIRCKVTVGIDASHESVSNGSWLK